MTSQFSAGGQNWARGVWGPERKAARAGGLMPDYLETAGSCVRALMQTCWMRIRDFAFPRSLIVTD